MHLGIEGSFYAMNKTYYEGCSVEILNATREFTIFRVTY